jgi:hypothetical protein
VSLAEVLRDCVLADASISEASRGAGVPQPTLQEFAVGRPDGSFADIRLSSAQKLINYYGISELGNVPQVIPKRSRRVLLAAELKASECQDSPEKFRERLVDGLVEQYPEQTIDGLLCTPLDALAYCERIREGVGSECLADFVILKALMNVRKSKNCPVGLKRNRTRTLLKAELLSAGCESDAAQFRELVVDCLSAMYRDRTVDELVCQPREARMFCNYVRQQARCSALRDQLILSTLMNVRKAS